MNLGDEDQTGSSSRKVSPGLVTASGREKSRKKMQTKDKEVLTFLTNFIHSNCYFSQYIKKGFLILQFILPCPSMIEIEVLNIKWNKTF